MQTTVREVLNIKVAMDKIGALDLPIPVALKVRKNRRAIKEVVDEFNIRRDKLLQEHGKRLDNGNFSLPPIKVELVNEKLETHMNEELDWDIEVLSISELGSDLNLSADDLENLENFLDLEGLANDQSDVAA